MLGKRRLTVATVAVVAGAGWAVFIAPGSQVAAAPAKGDTVRTSVSDGGPPGGGDQAPDGGNQSVVSGNGLYDVFVSPDDLDPNIQPNNGHQQVFVRGLGDDRTTQISVASDDGDLTGGGANEDVNDPSISADGRYVSFVTDADNVVGFVAGFPEFVAVCDRDPDGDGQFDEIVGGQPDIRCVEIAHFNDISSPPKLSSDGSILVWGIPGNGDNTFDRIEVASILNGAGDVTQPDDLSEISATPTLGTSNVDDPVVSGPTNNGGNAVYHVVYSGHEAFGPVSGIFDTTVDGDGGLGTTTRRDTDSDNNPDHFVGSDELEVSHPAVSGDGNVVAYEVDAGGSPPAPQVYVSSPFTTTTTVTLKPTATPSEFAFGDGIEPALSADGRYVAFVTDQADMVDAAPTTSPPNRTCINPNGAGITSNNIPCQVVVRDLFDYKASVFGGGQPLGFAQLASVSIKSDCGDAGPPCVGDFDSEFPSLSEHGAKVGFDSFADDLVLNDTNFFCDFYCEEEDGPGTPVEDAFARTWKRSVKTPDLSVGQVHVGSGKAVQYTIKGTGFGGQVINKVFITAVIGDGLSVDDTGCGGGSSTGFVLYQGQTCTVTVIFAPTAVGPVQGELHFKTDGVEPQNPAIISGTGTPPLPPGNHEIVRTSVGDGDPGLQSDDGTAGDSMVSGNGRYDVFVTSDPVDGRPTRGHNNVFVRDLRTNTTQQISLGANTAVEGPTTPNGTVANGDSFEPSISANGRLVSFLTDATNVVQVNSAFANREIVVVCDRDPDGDGVFDEPQAGHPKRPDFACIAVSDAYRFSLDQSPRLAPDGQHIVFVECTVDQSNTSCLNADNAQERVVLDRLVFNPGLTGFTDITPLVLDSFGSGADRNDPQVSDEGLFGDPLGVRVTYYTGFRPSAVWVVNVASSIGAKPHRIDKVPPGPLPTFCEGVRPCFLGDSDAATVGEPSMTDDGSAVAFERTNDFSAIAEVYIADVNTTGHATTRFVATTKNGNPVRAADPALSGDGRYISYVTDRPNFDGGNQKPPFESCLVTPESDFLADPAPPGYTPCQIVARDLVLDADRASTGLDPLPDALVTVGAACSSAPTLFGSTCGGDNDSLNPSMSRTGSEVGFDSYADDLVPKDTNPVDISNEGNGLDAFVRTFFPTATLAPVSFGDVPVGSSSNQSGTLTVTGFGPYQLAGATVGGTNPGDFTVTGGTCALPGQVLHLGEMCDLSFTFTPGGKGPRSGTITVSGENNPITTTITVTGDGSVTTSPIFSADPDPVKFGSGLPLDKPGRTRTVTITNGGGSTLVLSQVSVMDGSVPDASADYTVDLTACNFGIVPAGGTCKIKVTWVGHAVGSRQAILRFVDNAPGGLHMVGLRANVPAPSVTLTPSVVPTGRLTAVTGKGFAPKRNVRIFFPDSGETATGTTSSHGNFSAPLIIFPNGILGHRMVEVRSAHADKSISAKKKLLVVLGTLQSPTLVIRH